jgi:hypothetical protein
MTVYWIFFLATILLMFTVGEVYALAYNKQTLSRFIWDVSKIWPPLPWVMGLVTGFVAAHFFWGGSLICY